VPLFGKACSDLTYLRGPVLNSTVSGFNWLYSYFSLSCYLIIDTGINQEESKANHCLKDVASGLQSRIDHIRKVIKTAHCVIYCSVKLPI